MNHSLRIIKNNEDEFIFNLINENKDQLYRIALAYLHSEEDALEAIQETTYKAYKSRRKLKKSIYAKSWIIRILINSCKNELKKRKRIITLFQEQKEVFADAINDRLDIQFALQQLQEKYREVVLLKYFEDLKIKEIAEVLNRPEGTIKTWLNKALKELKNILGEEGEYFE